MVTKGVLKDHLLLLGNSMTCAGKLIGFNAAGVKYLSRSLDVQVPFMNATLAVSSNPTQILLVCIGWHYLQSPIFLIYCSIFHVYFSDP